MADKKNDVILNLLKTATYSIVGTASTLIIQVLGDGMDIKSALVYGIAFGVIAGIKNFVKHAFDVDLDLARLKQ